MQTTIPLNDIDRNNKNLSGENNSAVAWSAIIAGAFTAAAVLLILLLLGSGLGLASISVWSNSGVNAATFTAGTAIWLIIMQWISSGLGGYMAGRLRTKWMNMHSDEVFFRDTAHGFLVWALATVVTAAFLASATSAIVGSGVNAATSLTSGIVNQVVENSSDNTSDPIGYFVDSLYRSNGASMSESGSYNETMRIFRSGLQDGTLSDTDKAYVAQLISARTGLNQAEASNRVNDVLANITTAKETTREYLEKARKNTMQIALYTFISMLIGAFIASASAALGGKHRDEY